MPEAVSQPQNQSTIGNPAPPKPERLQPKEETGARRNLQSAQKTDKKNGQGQQAARPGTQTTGKGMTSAALSDRNKKTGKRMKQTGKNLGQAGQNQGLGMPKVQQGANPNGKQNATKLNPDQETPAARGLNMAQKQSMRQKIKQAKKTVGQIKEQANQLFQRGTAELLKQSWLNVISSYGLTLLYINFHFIAKYIGSLKLFCDFGEEWTAKMDKLSQAPGGGQAVKVAKTGLKFAEIIAILFIDCLLILIFFMVLIYTMLPIIIPIVIAGTVLIYLGII